MTQAAKIISFIFHPLWMPLISFVYLTNLDHSLVHNEKAYTWILVLLGINIVVPALSLFYLIRKGALSGIELKNRSERTMPYLLVIIYYLIFYYVLWRFEQVVSPLIYSMFFSIICTLILALIINSSWKISVHLLAIGGLCGALAALPSYHPEVSTFSSLVYCILIAGWIGFARIKLKAHTPKQVYYGFALGFAIQFLFVYQGYHLVLNVR